MRGRKLWAAALAAAMLMGNGVMTNAEEINVETDLLRTVVSNLEKGYSEYYDILDTELTLCSSHDINGTVENIYLLDMAAVLKADSVEQMDYYQGVMEYCDTSAMDIGDLNAEANQLRMNMIVSEKADIYEELGAYIGKEQSLIFYVKETYPADDESEKEILLENGMDYVSWEEMLPDSHEELRANGFSRMSYFDSEYVAMGKSALLQQTRASYSIDDAVDYMTTYTSNPSSCNVCGSSCDSKVDTTKYNSKYKHYVSVGSHVDCANYVSQALYAGGLSTDSTWKAESSAWISVSKLTDYMTSNNHWTSVTYNNVKKGDIVSFTSYSHVVMITSFDGTTYKFSGHTNDRLNSTIKINSSTKSSYNFYRVS